MKIGLAQVNSTVADLSGNVDRIVAAAKAARRDGADIVVFPELAVCGCSPRDIFFDTSFVSALESAHEDLAARVEPCPVVVGSAVPGRPATERHPGLWNAALVLSQGKLQAMMTKQDLRCDGVHFEPRWFESGPPGPNIEVAGHNFGVFVGADFDSRCGPGDSETVAVCIAASEYEVDGPRIDEACLRNIRGPAVFVNGCGANDERILGGRSFVVSEDRRVLARLPADAEAVRVVDLQAAGVVGRDGLETVEELANMLVVGIRDFALKNALGRAVIGLSGGIDSSVVACLLVRALGADRVEGVAMPSRYTDARSTEAARELARRLGINLKVVGIDGLHCAAEESLGATVGSGIAAENIQARLRMTVLMAVVDGQRGFLVNTSNKTELALGYGTLYGDLSGAVCPIGDLDKLQVVEMAHWLSETAGNIPQFVLERPPTAELRPGQVDPFDYSELVPVVNELVLRHRCNSVMRSAEHKRRQAGVVLKVSRGAFGSGRLFPVTRR